MKKLKKAVSAVAEGVFIVLAVAIGGLLAAAAFIWHFIPKWKREEARDTAAKVAGMKAVVREAHETRVAETAGKIAEVEKKADEQKAADTVDLANDLILKG